MRGKLPQGVGGADAVDISMEEEEEGDQVSMLLVFVTIPTIIITG